MLILLLFQRLERNQEREKESANLEYLKNVILQFLKCRPSEREHLVPVLTTMLKLSQDEKDLVIQQARGIVNFLLHIVSIHPSQNNEGTFVIVCSFGDVFKSLHFQ